MSTVTTAQPPQPPSDNTDPYRYGWRYVRIDKPDGTEEFDQVPLTLEDVLFPEVGDFIVQSKWHHRDVFYLDSVFELRLAGNPRAQILSDCRVDWNLPGVRPLGPDVAVFLDVDEDRDWTTFDIAAEAARPAMVVEVTSPATRSNDVGPKFDYYRRAKVPLYVIADVVQDDDRGRRVTLTAYRYVRGRYRKIALDPRGWIWLDPVGVWLGVTVDQRTGYERLACYDQQGQELGDYTAVSQALAEAIAAQARAEEMATAEAQAREQAERQAAAEAQAREQAEARIRELEAMVKRLERGT